MATIILQRVGSALGGPIGGAIGTLIGGQIDQRVFAGARREGPRLDDLAIQGASYGAPIPAIYGTMRVAGTLVWATELVESESVSGAKGQPETTTFSYSANFAVALSSRPGVRIDRIWADGKLLRGAAGDLKVGGTLRFLDGGEDQAVDPLIGSHEGDAPAYRGCVLAVFEQLELAEYGNRIPLLTFELVADAAPPTLGAMVEEASGNVIQSDDAQTVAGYAVYGSSRRSALQPLVDLHDMRFRALPGGVEQVAAGNFVVLDERDLGCAAKERMPRLERWSEDEAALPRSVSIDYHDPARDYQVGRAASLSGGGQRYVSIEAPMVLGADEARSAAEAHIARSFGARDKVRLRLPPRYSDLKPGDWIETGELPGRWRVDEVTFEELSVEVLLSRDIATVETLPADAGRFLPAPDIVRSRTVMAMFDPPDLGGGAAPSLMLAAANASEGWRSVPVEVDIGGSTTVMSTSGREAVLGFAEDVLGPGHACRIDRDSTITVALVDSQQALLSVDDEALFAGANLALLGDEVIQFRDVMPLGDGRYRLSHFIRGVRGSEWAMAEHISEEPFVMVDRERLAEIPIQQEKLGSDVSVLPVGLADEDAQVVVRTANGEAMRPPSPVKLGAERLANGDLEIRWIRRSRLGFGWSAGEVPLGEASIHFDVLFESAATSRSYEDVSSPFIVAATDLSAHGSGSATISVSMRGDRAVSRPASISITL